MSQSRVVLIVDDSPEDRELYRRYLRRDREYFYTLLEANLGGQGLELWQQHQPDAVLLDYRLPDLDGLEFLARLQSLTRQSYLPVIMVTGQGNEAIAVQAMKASAQDYLVKEQITPEGLQLAVNGAIETVQLRTQLQQRIERERLVSQITQKIHQTLDLAEILQTTVSEVRQFLQTDRVLIVRSQSDGWGTVTTESVVADYSLLSGSYHDPYLSEDYVEHFRQGLVTLNPDIYDASIAPDDVELLRKLQVRANLIVPILQNRQLWGMLIAHHCAAPRQWQPLEVDLLKELATQVGIALQQAELYQQAQNELAERRRVEAELRDSEERFRTSVENMLDCFGVYRAVRNERGEIVNFQVEYVNDAACLSNQMTCTQPSQGLDEFLPGYYDSTLFDEYCQVVETGQSLVKDSLVYEDDYGQQRLVRAFDIRVAKFGDGFVATWRDITDRKQVEQSLRQSEEFKRRILESSSDCIKLLDLNGQLLYINTGGLCLLEIDDFATYLNEDWTSFWQDDDRTRAEEAIVIAKTGELSRFQGFCPTAKGTPKWWDVAVTPILDTAGHVSQLLAISRDITERQQAEQERDRLLQLEQTARLEAERANRIKDEFLAVLSHELRSPLSPILGWTKLLQTRKFDETKMAEALATIERNAKLQTQLIDDLLDIAKILRGKLSIDAAPVNLAFVIESALDAVRTAAAAKSILLHPVLPNVGQVSGDSTRLQQIVWNLLANAIKFTPKGGRVETRLERVGEQARIIVSDTGKGINPEFLPHIFESFRQEDVSITRKYGGLGLGLAIVRQLVEAHGGTIAADSPGEGLGATFTVYLPLLDVEPEIEQTEELPQQALDLTGIRVLTVDDRPDVRELLTELLALYGAEILTVASAAEVLANLESFQPDVLVSDIGMPEVDGYTLLQQIRTLPPEKGGQIPAIALTAYAREDDRQRAIASGYQRHVTKPLEPEQLVKAVVELARGKRLLNK
ncbi:response regulator [Nostocaceae cyanobacterium CENA369]|uniref:histidine kinase n=1 Tax=Dendronalium phyllosphericum CENA369 TaxID=1725256 RepID=A0A8J7HXY1_9NOST|nr:response regulator [Dendronalium phyllosphericum]MBH8572235.1 response regulator [Dendronalium phyllosphericum CENA369]